MDDFELGLLIGADVINEIRKRRNSLRSVGVEEQGCPLRLHLCAPNKDVQLTLVVFMEHNCQLFS